MTKEFLDILRCPLTGSRLTLDACETVGGEVEFGVLIGDGGEYPIVNGIPVLKHGQSELVSLIESGEPRRATACAIAGDKQSTIVDSILSSKPALRKIKRFTRDWERGQRRSWLDWVAEQVIPVSGPQPDARTLFDFYFRRCGARSDEAYHYYFCRFGMPCQFVALSFVHSLGQQHGFVLDHSCGAGHLTWGLSEAAAPAQTIGFDLSFFNLYVARKIVAPQIWYACGEILQLPFRQDIFSAIFNSDAFTNFSAKAASFREMIRTCNADANILLVWLRNRNRDHLYPNKPLTPAAYRRVVDGYSHRAIADLTTLNRYLNNLGVGALHQSSDESLEKALTLSLWVIKGKGDFAEYGSFHKLTVPFHELVVNPIYQQVSASRSEKRFVRRYPSPFYAAEDAELKHYYPEQFVLSDQMEAALREGNPKPVYDLLRVGAVVGYPHGYAGQPSSPSHNQALAAGAA